MENNPIPYVDRLGLSKLFVCEYIKEVKVSSFHAEKLAKNFGGGAQANLYVTPKLGYQKVVGEDSDAADASVSWVETAVFSIPWDNCMFKSSHHTSYREDEPGKAIHDELKSEGGDDISIGGSINFSPSGTCMSAGFNKGYHVKASVVFDSQNTKRPGGGIIQRGSLVSHYELWETVNGVDSRRLEQGSEK